MPIPFETTAPTPNAVYIPQIVIHCGIVDGQLRTSAQIILSGAIVTNAGEENENWVQTGQTQMIQIPDVMNLDADLASLQTDVYTVFGGIINLIGAMNSIRKVL